MPIGLFAHPEVPAWRCQSPSGYFSFLDCGYFIPQYSTTSFDMFMKIHYQQYSNFFLVENPCFLFWKKLVFYSKKSPKKWPFHIQYVFFRLKLTFFRNISIFGSKGFEQHCLGKKCFPLKVPIWARSLPLWLSRRSQKIADQAVDYTPPLRLTSLRSSLQTHLELHPPKRSWYPRQA